MPMTVTSSTSLYRRFTRLLPIKPAAPVTNIVLPLNSTLLILRNSNLFSLYKAVVIIWDDVVINGCSQRGIRYLYPDLQCVYHFMDRSIRKCSSSFQWVYRPRKCSFPASKLSSIGAKSTKNHQLKLH